MRGTRSRSTLLLMAMLVVTASLAGCLDQAPGAASQDAHDQAAPGDHGMHASHGDGRQHDPAHAAADPAPPSSPGQSAFGAIQEIIQILEDDPATNWSKVRIDLLREHLIDMDELTLNAQAVHREVPGGVEITVEGQGRTVEAIQRMVPTHARMTLDEIEPWTTTVEQTANGANLTVVSDDPDEVAHIRGLGFLGLMATGADHPTHHLMLARGEMRMDHGAG